MKDMLRNESGDSYTWLALCIMVIVMTGVYLVVTLIVSDISAGYDGLIGRDMVTEQNLECFNFNLLLFKAIPVIILLTLSMWAIVHTIKSKSD